ncbi:MAG: hypothetical protein ABF295_09515 [Flavobacteriaceae bacterium]
MYRPLIYIVLIIILAYSASCRKDFQYRESGGRLEFSKDTVYLDTVFTNIGSSTYTLKVYNRTGDDILIPSVQLEQGLSSNYRLNVDGEAGKVFEDVTIMARDSIFIFIETTFDIGQVNQNEFLYTDVLLFISSTSEQRIPLVTLIKDAIFLFPSVLADGTKESIVIGLDPEGNEISVEGFILENSQLDFTREKPYVIYGYAAVDENDTLMVEAGSRIHFHKDSGILIGEGASININGELSTDQELMENQVILEGDRLEPEFSEIAGQWGTLWLAPGSLNAQINHCTIKNATVGLLVEGLMGSEPTLTIKNSQIYNSGTVNLWGRNTGILAENVVLGNAGEASLLCDIGGNYEFLHCTFANYWSGSFRTGSALQLSNFGSTASGEIVIGPLENAMFSNCIIYGNTPRELSLRSDENTAFNFNFSDVLLKFNDGGGQTENDPLYDFENDLYYTNIILNEDPVFLNTARNDFRLEPESSARDTADIETALRVPLDILGTDRTPDPDLGAFEYTTDQ